MSLPVIPLRKLLDEATRGPWTLEDGAPWRIVEARGHFGTPAGVPDPNPRRAEGDAALAALAPELAALVLDQHAMIRAMRRGGSVPTKDIDALLARLDQLGKEPGDEV